MRPINIFNPLITWNNPFGVDVPLMGRNQKVYLQKQELSQSEFLSKDADLLLNFFSSGVFFFTFLLHQINYLVFSSVELANVEGF